MADGSDEISDDVLEEGCYYLSQMGVATDEIARHFGRTPAEVRGLVRAYSGKLASGEVAADEFDRQFWADVRREAEGDIKLTVVSDKGVHHVWRSELGALDGRALMALYESSRDFLGSDPNQRFLDYPPPKGYDPLAMDREVRKSVGVIGELLEAKWKNSAR